MYRVAAVSPEVTLGNPAANAARIINLLSSLDKRGVSLAIFPELSVSGYSCGDLFHSATLLDASVDALIAICRATTDLSVTAIVGIALRAGGSLYNCAVVCAGGRPLAAIPKRYIPNYNEFYEYRWFAIPNAATPRQLTLGEWTLPLSTDIIIDMGAMKVGVEICEDLWVTTPPSSRLSLAGANVIANLSASNDLIGKHDYLISLIRQQSARCQCAYIYASAGWGESSTDLVFDGKDIIAENGSLLAQSERWQLGDNSVVADIDIEALDRDRMHNRSFGQSVSTEPHEVITVINPVAQTPPDDSIRFIDPHPFVPVSRERLADRCEEIINIQALGLARRLKATHCSTLVAGISGGLDSTLALLVACKAFDMLELPRTGIIGVTMPGFGTTGRTYNNALKLMEQLGITIRQVPIAAAVRQHFADIGHDIDTIDVTYENSQARERTQILMDIANQTGGMVLGTGDLSELALGWATYNGDHMSMYGVNAGVPKTLVRHLVSHYADTMADPETRQVLADIVDTPISPELTPAGNDGQIAQKTEDLVGPYELHDFFLYYTLRYGFKPSRIYQMALAAFDGHYDAETIQKWLRTFIRRFFNQQFKRSCLPDGPKVGSVCLSPRGDWRMPSDISSSAWLAEFDDYLSGNGS